MKLSSKSDKFWLFSSLVSSAVIYLNLVWKSTESIDRLSTESLFWVAILWLLWRRRDKLKLKSNVFATVLGSVLLILTLFKGFSLFWFESKLICFLPFMITLGLALIASGFKGLKQYWQELFFAGFLFFPVSTIIDKLINITVLNAKISSFLLHYVGFNVGSQSNEIFLYLPDLGKFTAIVGYSCTGLSMMVLMLRLSLLLIAFFPLPKKEHILIPLESVGIGFGVGVIRVCILTLLLPEQAKFDYWHGSDGAQIFSTIGIVLFSFFCHFVLTKYNLLDSTQKTEVTEVAEVTEVHNSGV